MISERAVLLRVEHLKERRCRVSPEVASYLIHLVKEEQRIVGAALADAVDDPARDGAYVRAPVASYLSLIPYTAQRHPYELPVGGSCYGFRYRSLSDSRRTYKADDRTLVVLCKVLHGKAFKYPFLHLLESVMIFVEDLLGPVDIAVDLAGLVPRKIEYGLYVCARYVGVRTHRAHLRELVYLLAQLGIGLLV